MNARLSLLSAAFLSFALCAPAYGSTPLFTETFDTNSGEWNSPSGGPSSDNTGWSFTKAYKAKKAIRLGTTSYTGSATSPSIPIPEGWSKASVSVSFQAAAWFGYSSGLTLSKIEDGVTSSIDSWSVLKIANNEVDATNTVVDLTAFTADANGKSYEASFEVRGPFSLVFETTGSGNNRRSYLDSIVVTADEIVSTLTPLGTPANLSATSTNYFGFTLSWDTVTDATNGYTVTLSPTAGNVTVNGTTATVTGLAEGSTNNVSVVAKGDGTGTDDSEAATLRVVTLKAPAVTAPNLSYTVSSSALTVSWSAQSDAAFSVLAWTNKPVNVANENFEDFPTVPGWTFNTDLDTYNDDDVKIKLDSTGESVVSPTYPGVAAELSFKLKGNTADGSSLSVSGSSDGSTWTGLTNIVFTTSTKVNQIDLSGLEAFGMRVFKWEYTKNKGGAGFGSVSVTGTGVGKEPVYLPGYGSSPAAVAGTSVTFADPVAGETYCVEVTATGLSGRTAKSTIEVPVSRRHPSVIAVQ